MNQYAIYLRKSRADLEAEALGEGETLARHYNILMKLAEKHSILPAQITIYKEIVSGESISERPQMQALLNDVYQKKYVGVLVVEIERLARGNTKDQGTVAEAFQFSNTKIITPLKIYDPNNEFDQEYLEFGLFMSRREYKTIRRRMEAGKNEAVSEGNYLGSTSPYGYNIERKNKKDRYLVPNPDEAPIVQMIFNWFTEDKLSCGQIAKKLTDMQIPTQSGNREWHKATIKSIVQNEHYYGMIRWNRRKRTAEYDADNNLIVKTQKRQPKGSYKLYKGKHQALITEEQFNKAQSLFSGIAPVKANTTLVNPLAGILFCADCGRMMAYYDYSKKGHDSRFIHKPSKFCKMKSCKEDLIIDAICQSLKAYIADYEIKISNNHLEEFSKKHHALIESLEAELIKQQKKRRKLFDAFEEGIYTNEEFIERKNNLNEIITSLNEQLEIENNTIPNVEDYEEKIVTLHQAIDVLKDNSINARQKNNFLKSVIKRIDYSAEDLGRQHGVKPILDIYLL